MDLEKFGTAGDVQELLAIRDRIEGLMDERRDASAPKADLLDDGEAFRLVIEVPGVPEENIEIALQGQTLLVAGIREPQDGSATILFSERQSGHFQRSIALPEPVDRERTSAHLKSGLLTVNLPKE
ncbi:MAG TPA: Hsp20/alpha crystallin family protein [Trueperaceae bacterium]